MTKRTPTADPGASNAPSTDDVLSSCEAAAFLKTTESQLATMRYQGRGPSFVRTPGGRTIRYLRTDLIAWLEAGKVLPDSSRRFRA